MERRENERHTHRLKIHFQEMGTDKSHLGYTVNISTTGLYLVSGHLASKGARLRMQLVSNGNSVILEGVVVRVQRSLHSLKPSGMAMRFLKVDELVSELVPEIGAVTRESPADEPGVYRLQFADRRQFLETFERDLSTGGLFVPSSEPPQLGDVIQVELAIAGGGGAPVRFEARVVHRLEPSTPDGTSGNLMAGVGVELLNFEGTLAALRGLADRFR